MRLLGMFVAKCVQDGRRVDLPLSAPFFKLMCTPGAGAGAGAGQDDASSSTSSRNSLEAGSRLSSSSPNPTSPPPAAGNPPAGGVVGDNDWEELGSNQTSSEERSLHGSGGGGGDKSNQRSDSSLDNDGTGAARQRARGEAGLKEEEGAGLLLVDEISKDGSPKASVSTEGVEGRAWFEGILKREDMEEVDPYRSRFLRQLRALLGRRDEVQRNQALSSLEKEQLLSGLTLPGTEENLPGPKVEDLW